MEESKVNQKVKQIKRYLTMFVIVLIACSVSIVLFAPKPTIVPLVDQAPAQQPVVSLGLPDQMVKQFKQYNIDNPDKNFIYVDACSYLSRISEDSWKIKIGNC